MSAVDEIRTLGGRRVLQLGAVAAFLVAIGAFAFYTKLSVIDNDIWWHLKVGDWIIAHAAVPHTGILSRTTATRPWIAYSWGYEVVMSLFYRWMGIVGIGVYGTLLTLAVAAAVYWMLQRISGHFWIALTTAAVCCSAFLFNGMPRPVFFTMVLFCLTLTLLLETNRDGAVRRLYWLPAIFMLWANLHIQFIYGLFLVGLFLGAVIVQGLIAKSPWKDACIASAVPVLPMAAIFGACVLATLIGPNFYRPYVAVYEYSKAKFAYSIIVELQPLSFRGYAHYAELMLGAAAFFAVGWRKRIDLFKLAMLAVCSIVAYRTMRDAWFLAIPAAACIVDFPAPEEEWTATTNWKEGLGIAGVVAALLFALAPSFDFTQRGIDRAISREYPVNAVNFLRRNPQPGPLYNNLGWGGFLMWYMPDYPVAIDGRNDLYGDDLDKVFYASQNADEGYKTDPYLNESGVVLLDGEVPLAKILSIDPRFKLMYRDAQSVVYARR